MIFRFHLLFSFLLLTTLGFSNNLQITNLTFNSANGQVGFNVSWDNSWHDATGNFHDAVWVFVKYKNPGEQWKHAQIQIAGSAPSGMAVVEPLDLNGAFIKRESAGSGSVPSGAYTFDVNNTLNSDASIKVFGIEMVNIPTGGFYIGGPIDIDRYTFNIWLHNPSNVDEGVLIQSENTLSSSAYDVANDTGNQFDNDIPAAYPKGYTGFYCMKYKMSQLQYVEFLNTLSANQQNARVAVDLNAASFEPYVMSNSPAVMNRNGIYYDGISSEGNHKFGCNLNQNTTANEASDGQNLDCNYLSQDDLNAYLDWAALRPMSKFEHWKICRGSELPVQNEFAWGSSIIHVIDFSNITNSGTASESLSSTTAGPIYADGALRSGIHATASSNRVFSGATFYGVMDMTNGMGEFYVDFQSADLNFTASLGDGQLSATGDGTNPQALKLLQSPDVTINMLIGTTSFGRGAVHTGRGVR